MSRPYGQIRIRVDREDFSLGVALRAIIDDKRNGKRWKAKLLEWEECTEDRPAIAEPIEPFLFVDMNEDALQQFMDELWRNGVRPSDIGTPGHLAATKEHLQDMRKLVEKAYEVKL